MTHKVPTSYPQAPTLQSPLDRIILYPYRSEPLDIGFCAKSQTQVNRQIQANFLAELKVISTAKPLLRRATEASRRRPCSGMSVAGKARTHQQQILGTPRTFDFGQGAAGYCP
jgi:hypothetical protein